MTKENYKKYLIETLRKEKENLLKKAEIYADSEKYAIASVYREQAIGINSVLCMLTSDDYLDLVAKQNGIEKDAD